MKAIILESFGGPEVLQYKSMDVPVPAEGEVLIRVEKASVNYADIKNRTGKKAKGNFPLLLGLDAAGVIEQIGPGVKELNVGQRVMAFPKNGSYAQYVIAKEELTYALPDEIDMTTAAASPIVSFLSYKLIKDIGRIERGDTVLIHSAAGGVGTTAIQFAKQLGAGKIIGTVGDESKFSTVLEAGASDVCTYDHFTEKVQELTEGEGADLILDSISGKIAEESMNCLAPYGRLVHFGNTGGEAGAFKTNQLHASCRSVLGFSLGTTRKKKPHLLKEISQDILSYLANGSVKINVGAEFPLSEAAEAHRLMESRRYTGKILLNMSE
ncbi:quinone oxidoreductase family protein [Metabacillus iocasae]|uniref:NADPH2:quinone reductase n=1 Tax=Priestia iocasae TaxID=2291674 RepID=A0ABS2QSK2_9BACI|nr:zinc-binding dehydrogenase [Metabacillus iocasae]MBM7702278.1 NADPH2:quinone reductase [Metabacillus iocasae]